jgi:hypothetical protein
VLHQRGLRGRGGVHGRHVPVRGAVLQQRGLYGMAGM